jgi:hypothetical protein
MAGAAAVPTAGLMLRDDLGSRLRSHLGQVPVKQTFGSYADAGQLVSSWSRSAMRRGVGCCMIMILIRVRVGCGWNRDHRAPGRG